MKHLWILDNGHGKETAGKRSPIWEDGSQLFEYEFNRDVVSRISDILWQENIDHEILVPEDQDVSLANRVKRANVFAKKNPNSIVLSIHGNAGGGQGWEIWTVPSEGVSNSDKIAMIFYQEVQKEFLGFKMRKGLSEKEPDKEAAFTILTKTTCPAILTENFFYDDKEECRLMMTDKFRQKIAKAHVDAILKIEKNE